VTAVAAPVQGTGRIRALAVLAPAVAFVVAAGVWGLTTTRDHGPAGIGEAVAFEGGSFVVERVTDVDLSHPMAGPGMQMNMGAGVPEIPEGFRHIDVDVTVTAGSAPGLQLEPDGFLVQGTGLAPSSPATGSGERSFVPDGGRLTRTLTFQVPEDSTEVLLSAPGGERPVAVVLDSASSTGNDHGHAQDR
jgi:hypothetical protein